MVMGCQGGRLAARIAGGAVCDRGAGRGRVGAGRGGVPLPDLLHHLASDRACRVRPGRVRGQLAPALAVEFQTFCPYKGACSYYDVGDAHRAAWSYRAAWPEVGAVADFISFEPDLVEVSLDGRRLRQEPGQSVIPHGIDRDLSLDEAPPGGRL
jgi:Domain of unknown function (DUF427)